MDCSCLLQFLFGFVLHQRVLYGFMFCCRKCVIMESICKWRVGPYHWSFLDIFGCAQLHLDPFCAGPFQSWEIQQSWLGKRFVESANPLVEIDGFQYSQQGIPNWRSSTSLITSWFLVGISSDFTLGYIRWRVWEQWSKLSLKSGR